MQFNILNEILELESLISCHISNIREEGFHYHSMPEQLLVLEWNYYRYTTVDDDSLSKIADKFKRIRLFLNKFKNQFDEKDFRELSSLIKKIEKVRDK